MSTTKEERDQHRARLTRVLVLACFPAAEKDGMKGTELGEFCAAIADAAIPERPTPFPFQVAGTVDLPTGKYTPADEAAPSPALPTAGLRHLVSSLMERLEALDRDGSSMTDTLSAHFPDEELGKVAGYLVSVGLSLACTVGARRAMTYHLEDRIQVASSSADGTVLLEAIGPLNQRNDFTPPDLEGASVPGLER